MFNYKYVKSLLTDKTEEKNEQEKQDENLDDCKEDEEGPSIKGTESLKKEDNTFVSIF